MRETCEDKAPSPRPPRAKRGEALRSVSVPQLRASVEVKPRRRAAPKPSAKRTGKVTDNHVTLLILMDFQWMFMVFHGFSLILHWFTPMFIHFLYGSL